MTPKLDAHQSENAGIIEFTPVRRMNVINGGSTPGILARSHANLKTGAALSGIIRRRSHAAKRFHG
jgi:hypothetical protein